MANSIILVWAHCLGPGGNKCLSEGGYSSNHFGRGGCETPPEKGIPGPNDANYCPMANIPFLGKIFEWVIAVQLQAVLEVTDYLEQFQSGFRPSLGTEMALIALFDDLH